MQGEAVSGVIINFIERKYLSQFEKWFIGYKYVVEKRMDIAYGLICVGLWEMVTLLFLPNFSE